MQFTGEITYIDGAGQVARRVAAGLGQFIREETDAIDVPITVTGMALKKVLTGRLGFWPSRGTTSNYGPYARDHSLKRFVVSQGRTRKGRFDHITLSNTATNRKGIAYAGFVAQGIASGGRTVSPERYRANYDCVARTWRERWPVIAAEVTADGS